MQFSEVRPRGRKDHIRIVQFSALEMEIVHRAGKGKTNREIAGELDLTAGTVASYLHEVYRALGLKSRHQLIVWYLQRARSLAQSGAAEIAAHPEPCDCDEPYCMAMREAGKPSLVKIA